jgi:hypothetical protein
MIMTETRERTGRLKEDKEDTRVFDRQKMKRPRSCRGKIEGASKLVSDQTGSGNF